MTPPSLRSEHLVLLHLMAEDASDAASRRSQEAAEVAQRLLALRIYRNGDRTVIASAIAEQTARTKLAEQAHVNAVAARVRLADADQNKR